MTKNKKEEKKDEPKEEKRDDKKLTPVEARSERLLAFASAVNKKYGAGFLGRASELLVKQVPRIPTGIIELDMAIGGGIPAGRTTMLCGEKSGGKSTVATKWTGAAQKVCSNCYQLRHETIDEKTGEVEYGCSCERGYRKFVVGYMDAEGAYDRVWGTVMGVNHDELLLAQPEYAEQCIDIVDAWLRTGDIDAVIVDSLAMLVPAKEVEDSSEEWQQGLQARLINKGCRKWNGAMNFVGRQFGRRPTLILINQMRMKIGVMWGNPEVKPGGKGQDFLPSIEVKLWSGPVEFEDKEAASKKPLWEVKRFKVEKNKLSPPFRSGEFTLVTALMERKKPGDFMCEEFVHDELVSRGAMTFEKEGGNIRIVDGHRFNGKGQVTKYWMDNPEKFEEVKQLLLGMALR